MKIWLIGVTDKGNIDKLNQLIEPIKADFDGLIWTFHYPKDEGAEYLESVKGDGEIIYSNWCGRLDYSRNHCLYQGPMKVGDWFFTVDTLERLSPDFTLHLRSLVSDLNLNDVDCLFLHGKRFAAKLKEETRFVGNPHEGISGIARGLEITKTKIWDNSFFQNTRPKVRDEHHWINAFMRYYLFPETNHLLLHFENNREFVAERYAIRSKFMTEIDKLGFDPYSMTSVKKCIQNNFTEELKECINSEKILNDWYRYEILGEREGFVDKHDFSLIQRVS